MLLCVLLICMLHLLSPIWIYYLACSYVWFCICTCIYTILSIFTASNCTFSFPFWFWNLRIISYKCSMNSIRPKTRLSNRLNNCLCVCRLFNRWYLTISFPSSSPCSWIFTSYFWLLVPFNNRIHFILWII